MIEKSVIAIVNYNDLILLGKKIEIPGDFLSGKWHIPGETLENNETDEQGLIRGMKEEAGIEIIVGKHLATSHIKIKDKEKIMRWYECFPKTYDIKPGSDLSEVKWVPRKEILSYIDKERIASLWPEEVKEYFKK